jgi:hypothetical protein
MVITNLPDFPDDPSPVLLLLTNSVSLKYGAKPSGAPF